MNEDKYVIENIKDIIEELGRDYMKIHKQLHEMIKTVNDPILGLDWHEISYFKEKQKCVVCGYE